MNLKNDGSLKMKGLNNAIKKDLMISTAQDVLSKSAGKKILSVIDMSSKFWQYFLGSNYPKIEKYERLFKTLL